MSNGAFIIRPARIESLDEHYSTFRSQSCLFYSRLDPVFRRRLDRSGRFERDVLIAFCKKGWCTIFGGIKGGVGYQA